MSLFLHIDVPSEWIAAAARGEPAAQRRLYESLARPVYTLLRRIVPRPAVAEELLQEVFVEVLGGLAAYRGSGPFAGWVRTIAVRRAFMHLRSPERAAPLAGDGAGDAYEALQARAQMESGASAGEEWHADLERALNALAPLARSVVWLHDVEGYTHAEIARLYGQTASFSKSQLARAHAELRARLEPADGGARCTFASTN